MQRGHTLSFELLSLINVQVKYIVRTEVLCHLIYPDRERLRCLALTKSMQHGCCCEGFAHEYPQTPIKTARKIQNILGRDEKFGAKGKLYFLSMWTLWRGVVAVFIIRSGVEWLLLPHSGGCVLLLLIQPVVSEARTFKPNKGLVVYMRCPAAGPALRSCRWGIVIGGEIFCNNWSVLFELFRWVHTNKNVPGQWWKVSTWRNDSDRGKYTHLATFCTNCFCICLLSNVPIARSKFKLDETSVADRIVAIFFGFQNTWNTTIFANLAETRERRWGRSRGRCQHCGTVIPVALALHDLQATFIHFQRLVFPHETSRKKRLNLPCVSLGFVL